MPTRRERTGHNSTEDHDSYAERTDVRQESDGVPMIIRTCAYDAARTLMRITRLVQTLATTEVAALFEARPRKAYYPTLSNHGQDVLVEISTINRTEIYTEFPYHAMNPYVDAYTRACQEHEWTIRLLQEPRDALRLPGTLTEKFVKLVSAIKENATGNEFKATLDNFRRTANKNEKALHRYIEAMQRNNARLLVLRIDLGYVSPVLNTKARPITYEDAKRDRVDFFKYLKFGPLRDSFIGFAWKLEYGLSKSYHYHVMLFLNGAEVRQDISLCRMIGEHWRNVVTMGAGLYFNCNAQKEKYGSYCGIGMIHYADAAAHQNLLRAASYLIKTDYHIKMVMPDKGRTFGKGNTPRTDNNRGRPRLLPQTLSNDLAA